jgi:hypothetical protein
MPNIVDRVMTTMAAASFATSHTPYQARQIASDVRSNLSRAQSTYDEAQRLDRKWNNGYPSETIGAGARLHEVKSQKAVLETYLKDQMSSSSTFPSQKEYAERTLRTLGR